MLSNALSVALALLPVLATASTGLGHGFEALSQLETRGLLADADQPTSLEKRVYSVKSKKTFKLLRDSSGKRFFDGWDFFNYPDPTHGLVNYQSASDAASKGLAYVNKRGNAILKVDTKANLALNQNRDSVRITSKQPFKKGQLLILDALHMPTGCATWPAFWTVGNSRNWPNGGEIDIVEGVNKNTRNTMVLHTTPGCYTALPMKGKAKVLDADCDVGTDNIGCGNLDPHTSSFGPGFNKVQGGVFATLWDDAGITIFFWPRDRIPADIIAGKPKPSNWGYPRAQWAESGCDTDKYFDDQTVVINTTICGDWCGSPSVYATQCSGTCAQRVMRGSNFSQAYWEIASVRVYQ